jgi:hypothetical protein
MNASWALRPEVTMGGHLRSRSTEPVGAFERQDIGGDWIAVHNLGDEYLYVHDQHAGSEVISVATTIADITPTSTATAESARFRSSEVAGRGVPLGTTTDSPPGKCTVVRRAEGLGALDSVV